MKPPITEVDPYGLCRYFEHLLLPKSVMNLPKHLPIYVSSTPPNHVSGIGSAKSANIFNSLQDILCLISGIVIYPMTGSLKLT